MGDVGTFTNGIEGYRIPGCVGCMFDLLCAVFPSSSLSQVPLFQSYTCFTPPPTGETDTQVSADVVKFQDPPGVTGSWGRLHGPSTLYGLMYLYVDPVYGPTAGQVVCSLPASEAALCNTVLNDFADRYTRG